MIGEVHGIIENDDVLLRCVETLVAGGKNVLVGFEWPSAWTATIRHFATGHAISAAAQNNLKALAHDGKLSMSRLALLGALDKKAIAYDGFDVVPTREALGWNARDAAMAERLSALASRFDREKLVAIASCGNLHAQRTPFDHDGTEYRPLGSVMPGALHVGIRYGAGAFYSSGRINSCRVGETDWTAQPETFDCYFDVPKPRAALPPPTLHGGKEIRDSF